jgi:sigma-B regulation protein RsbU (phosphoserine phosphatase)
LFIACGAAAIWLVDRVRLMQGRAETRREVVMALQSMSLPTALAQAVGYDLCGLCKPAHEEEEVGGDFYDFYPTGTGHYCLLMGDVMGKGKEAAASTALLRYSVRAFCSSGASPAQIISQLNALIETQGQPFETASLFVGLLESHSGCLRYANAGHEPPMLKRADGEEQVLDATGPILGIGLAAMYEEKTVALGPNDSLLLLTDGVTEARNKQGEFLGSAGAWWMLRTALRAPSARTVLASLDAALTDYISADRCDDIALLLLRRT